MIDWLCFLMKKKNLLSGVTDQGTWSLLCVNWLRSHLVRSLLYLDRNISPPSLECLKSREARVPSFHDIQKNAKSYFFPPSFRPLLSPTCRPLSPRSITRCMSSCPFRQDRGALAVYGSCPTCLRYASSWQLPFKLAQYGFVLVCKKKPLHHWFCPVQTC